MPEEVGLEEVMGVKEVVKDQGGQDLEDQGVQEVKLQTIMVPDMIL